ncbi:hypothetical protein [Ktedonospora formicarum]|uniref:Uncharacterized protein n=1 Tax=Ktedonospora formicarum TaxID=2778364 RepID=A0A8J3MWC8_9CHLR|nr:hypothetical protein [Ktedonospora formicarum]GHO48523.1 hypothetical protein KSX_66860 [Ktedonospora formicarum]
MAQLPQYLAGHRDTYMGIASALAEGKLPQVDGYNLLRPVFRGLTGDPAFVAWLNEQVESLSGGQYHLAESSVRPKSLGMAMNLDLTGPNGTKRLRMGPYNPGFRWDE